MHSSNQLGKLEPVAIRDVWKDEALDFTPWLARDESMAILSDVIGMTLEVQETEFPIGDFRLDILALAREKDDKTIRTAVIENQIGKTNHMHLGQLVTYAAGVGEGGRGRGRRNLARGAHH